MAELHLEPNMQLGVSLLADTPENAPEGHVQSVLLRQLGVRSCLVSCSWARLEPIRGQFSRSEFDALLSQLMRLRSLGIEPLLCLWHGNEPAWLGGWRKEESLQLYLRYVQHVLDEAGHLVAEYLTFAEPNALLLSFHKPDMQSLSTVAAAHLRSYRLIHDHRRARGFRDTAVGFALHMYPPSMGRIGSHALLRLYQDLPLRAMARGEFSAPLHNLTRAPAALYCDFLGLMYGLRKLRRSRQRDDLGREIWPEGVGECCAALLTAATRPVYLFDPGAIDWDDSFRARYIYEHLNAICSSHQPVLRYYYAGLLDGREQEEGLSARRGLFYTDPWTGEVHMKKSGEFFASLVHSGCVTEEDYRHYIAGQSYRQG